MFVITSLLLTRLFCAIAGHPQITAAPCLVARQAGNDVCGYYSLDDTIYPITCPLGNDCAVATTTTPAIIYCASSGAWSGIPITTVFGYGYWPVGGCGAGQGCCPESEPSAGIYTFDGGMTVQLGCGRSAFTYAAFELNGATPSAETTPTSTTLVVGTAGSSSRTKGSAATSPASSTSSSTTSSSGKTTVEIVVIVVLGVLSVTFFAIFLHFLKQVYKLHRSKYTPVAQTSPDLNRTPQPEKGLSRWSKIAGIASPCIALPSLGLALYVAFR